MNIRGSVESDDITELVYTVEVPIAACRYPYCNYKYCVFSDATKEIMKTPFEFIASQTATGKIIDRSLKFIDSVHLTKGGKHLFVVTFLDICTMDLGAYND